MSSFWKRPWIGYVASLLVATAPAVVLWWALPFRLPREQYALVLAVCVGVAARAWGEGPGVAGALGAFFALGIVSMPRFFNFHPDNTDEWIEVLVFVTSVMFLAVQVGRLRGREHQHARRRDRGDGSGERQQDAGERHRHPAARGPRSG